MRFLLSIVFFCMTLPGVFAQKTEIIIDADTGNEMDDLYAIVQAILDEKIDVKAIVSAHFNNTQLLTDSLWHIYPTKNINTVQISQDENEKLLESLDRRDIPHPLGCDRIVGYAWGYYEGAPIPRSPGVDYIIQEAKKASETNKCNIVCLGAVTNVAAAILLDSALAQNIRLYILSMKYDAKRKVWNKNSFNARNDINALDIILNCKNLELYVIPGQVSRNLVFERKKTIEKLSAIEHPVCKILTRRWDEVNAGKTWIMWDLALIEAITNPDFATLQKAKTPPENTQRQINVYTEIDVQKMKADFWKTLTNGLK